MNPLLAPLAALILGILASPWLDEASVSVTLPIAVVLAWLRPKLVVIVTFLAGSTLASLADAVPPRLTDDGYPARIVARVVHAPHEDDRGFSTTLSLEGVNGTPVSGRALVSYFPDTDALRSIFLQHELGAGDRIEILVRLRPPTTFRNPGAFDYRRHLGREGIFWTGTLRNPRLIRVLARGHHLPGAIRVELASRITQRIGGGGDVNALALGMVLGIRRGLGPDTEDRFQRAGLTHLLVVSGFNLAVVAAAALWIGRRLAFRRWRRSFRLGLTQAVVVGYALVVEGDAPVLRAAIMASLLIVGTLLDRGYRILTALTTSVFIILVFDPRAVEETGFLMTAIAVLAIDRLALPVIGWIRDRARRCAPVFRRIDDSAMDAALPSRAVDWRVLQRLRSERSGLPLWVHTSGGRARWALFDILIVTVAVQATLLPMTVEAYHRISMVSVPLNAVGAVIASIVTPLGLAVAILPSPLASGPAVIVDWSLRYLVAVVDLTVEVPGAARSVSSPPLWFWSIYGCTILGVACASRFRKTRAALTSALLALVSSGVLVHADFSPSPPKHPTFTFLDVGQGDSILIELPDGGRVLVDGGGLSTGPALEDSDEGNPSSRFSVGEDVVVPYLLSRGIRKLDAIALSHAHRDHMDGLIDVLSDIRVGELWLGPNPPTPGFLRLLESATRAQVPIRWLRAGDTRGPFRILHPPSNHVVGPQASNDDSLVLLLDTPTGSLLLAGDIESDLQIAPRRVTVLKVPHHGSRNSANNIEGVLRVISVGARNPFGHPHAKWLPALRTDTHGAIQVVLTADGPFVSFPGL